jgi:hypothetical protein
MVAHLLFSCGWVYSEVMNREFICETYQMFEITSAARTIAQRAGSSKPKGSKLQRVLKLKNNKKGCALKP